MALPPFPVLCRLHSDGGSSLNVKQHPFHTVPDKGKNLEAGDYLRAQLRSDS